jgi:hypothetical protein
MAAPSIYTGVTTQDQTTAANKAANTMANQSVMSAQQAPTTSATSKPGIIAGAMGNFTPYNGQQVATDDWTKQEIAAGAKNMGMDPMAYDKMLNPTTYGARWGIAAPASATGPANAASGVNPTVDATMTGPASTAAGYTPAQLGDPTKWNVTGDQTVAGQMQKLTDPNNPYYQQWATAGAQDAAARGFTGNSSIRSSGIIDSVMRNALPVAQSDAATYAKAEGYNTDQSNQFAQANTTAQNTAGQFNAGQANTASIAKLQSDTTKYGADVSAATQRYVSDQSASTQQAIAKMSNTSQAAISQAHDANSVLLQNNQTAQAAYNAYVNAVANIDIQPSMDKDAKAAAIITQTNIFNSAIAGLKSATSSTPDVTSPLDTSGFGLSSSHSADDLINRVDVSGLLVF